MSVLAKSGCMFDVVEKGEHDDGGFVDIGFDNWERF